jgi:hypothetical protein
MPLAEWSRLMAELRARDGDVCHYCGIGLVVLPRGGHMSGAEAKLWERRARTIDHKTPVRFGGSDEPSNLVLSCRDCNERKGTLPYEVFVSRHPRPTAPVESPPLPPIRATIDIGRRSFITVPMRAPGGADAELVARRDAWVVRLDLGWRKIDEAQAEGKDIGAWEDAWIGILREYERLDDRCRASGLG